MSGFESPADRPVRPGSPQAGWEVLDAARSRSFTGELQFDLDPRAHVYLDRGEVYLAECDGDPPIGSRLVAAGVLSVEELDTGTLEVAGERHLGRLFERVPTVERASVLVALEMIRDETLVWVAAQTCRSAVSRPYARHRSGVHRLCAAPPVMAPQLPAPLPPPRQVDRPIRADCRSVPSEPAELVTEPAAPSPGRSGDRDRFERFEMTWPSGEVEVIDLRTMPPPPPPPPRSSEPPSARHGRDSSWLSESAAEQPLTPPHGIPSPGMASPAVLDTAQLRLAVERTTSALGDLLDSEDSAASSGLRALPPGPSARTSTQDTDRRAAPSPEADTPAPVSAGPGVRRGSLATGTSPQWPAPDGLPHGQERRRSVRRFVDRLRGR